jgi:hypothetical protein
MLAELVESHVVLLSATNEPATATQDPWPQSPPQRGLRMSGMTPPACFGGYCVICGEKVQPGRYPFPLALASRSADHHGLRQRRSFGRKSRSVP